MTDIQVTQAIADIADGTPNTASEFRLLFTELFNRVPKTGTIVMKDVSNQYIIDNFDSTGLGINIEAGYAICNNENGTRNWAGRVPVAYGTGYTTIGALDGSKNAVLVSHNHKIVSNTTPVSNVFDSVNRFLAKLRSSGGDNQYELQATNVTPTIAETTAEGVSGTNKNMQPYIVTLVTMKL